MRSQNRWDCNSSHKHWQSSILFIGNSRTILDYVNFLFLFSSPPLLKNELSNVYFNNFLDMWPVLAARCKCSLSCSKSTSLSVWTVHCVTVSTCKWAVCTCAMLNRGCALCERKIRHSVTCKCSWLTALPFNMCVVSLSGSVAVPKRDAWKFLRLLN